MKKTIIVLGILASGFSLHAQSGAYKGKILNATGAPAANVTVQVEGSEYETETGNDGTFMLDEEPGKYTLIIHEEDRMPQRVHIEIKEGQALIKDIKLKRNNAELDEIVVDGHHSSYTASNPSNSLRLETSLLETPQNIQVVTGKVIADQQVISMSDGLIRNVSGAVRLEHWGDLYTNISMRGSQIQAFRNGFNVVSSYWGPLTEDMSLVDHIEFVKGPAGFMLANGDPSGLYNVVTKKPTGETKGEVALTMGSYDLYRASIDLDGKLSKDGRLLYRLNVAGQNKGSFRPNEFNNRYTFAPVISYQLDDKTKLTLEYNLQNARMSDVGSYYIFGTEGYATLPREFTTLPSGLPPTVINDHSLYATLQRQLNEDWKFTTQLSYFNYTQKGSSMWPADVNADGTMIRSVGIWDAKSEMTLGQAFLNGNVATGAVKHRILAGLDAGSKKYMADWADSKAIDSVGAPFDPKDPIAPYSYPDFNDRRQLPLEQRASQGGGLISQQYAGVYLQDEIRFWKDRIRLTVAGRYTYVQQSNYGGPNQTAKHFTPRAGLSVSIDKQTAAYALYDQAFIPQTGRLASGGDIKPITGNNIEFGIKRNWADGRWNTGVSVYRIIKNNELTGDPFSPPASGLSIVLGQKQAQGIEFDLRGEIFPGLSLTANYAYTDSKVTEVAEGITYIKVGDVIPGFAKHTANAWLSYRLQTGALKGLGIAGGFTYWADRATSNWSTSNTETNLPDYFKLDGGVFWEGKKLRVTLNIFNVLDEYLYSGAYYVGYFSNPVYSWQAEAGRNWRLGVTYKF